jgi:tetratricopeptide (TPR) repeat protein
MFVLVGVTSCAARSPLVAQLCVNPDAKLATVLEPLGGNAECDSAGAVDCDRLHRALDHLAVVCPAHSPTLLVDAVFAYQRQQPARAQQLLDAVLAQPASHPDAAVLRARIAIEEGNVSFARRLLEQQLQLTPDHSGLHETSAAAFYVEGRMNDAAGALNMAEKLGAPRWRVAYHRGLIEEAAGRFDAALRLYEEALKGHPGWPVAESRAKALRARGATP